MPPVGSVSFNQPLNSNYCLAIASLCPSATIATVAIDFATATDTASIDYTQFIFISSY